MIKDQLQFIMEGGSVTRYHTRPGIKPDTDAHHSHGVAMLCSLIMPCDQYGRTMASTALLMAALTHDLGEQYASDVGAPTKANVPGLRDTLSNIENVVLKRFNFLYFEQLTKEEKVVLHLADQFDGMMYCCREAALGNRNVRLVWRRWENYINQMAREYQLSLVISLRATEIFDAIREIYQTTISPLGPDFDVFSYEYSF